MTEERTQPVDRLSRVSVFKLFNKYDHEIPLGHDGGITIIHGPNGVGKTVILRLIAEILNQRGDIIFKVPFGRLELHFQSGASIIATRASESRDSVQIELHNDPECTGVTQLRISAEQLPNHLIKAMRRYVPTSWNYNRRSGEWVDRSDGERLTISEALSRFFLPKSLEKEVRETWENPPRGPLSNKSRVHMIGTDRLRRAAATRATRNRRPNPFGDPGPQWEESEERAVQACARDLKTRLTNDLQRYGDLTVELDRTFLRRFLSGTVNNKDTNELTKDSQSIDKRRKHLIELGVLDTHRDDQEDDWVAPTANLVSPDSRKLFSVYLDDQRRKLKVFDHIQNRVEIFTDRINRRLHDKQLIIDRDTGFSISALSPSGEPTTLEPADLSSGEQHEIILMYELLFLIRDGDLVLIDEPELSLHLEWQTSLCQDLRSIFRSTQVEVVMATHSPAIAGSAPDALVELSH